MSQIKCPEFSNLEPEIIADFNECLQENIEEIEYCINKLDESEDPDLIHELFRAMHSLKGNCRMVLLNPFVIVTHELEEIVSEMREGDRHYHHLYGSMIISMIVTMEAMIQELAEAGECNGEPLIILNNEIGRIRETEACTTGNDLEVLESVMEELVKLQEPNAALSCEESSSPVAEAKDSSNNEASELQQKNLNFFKLLANQLDSLTVYRRSRTEDLLKLSLAINAASEEPINETQLTAAVYIHDVGMAFVPPGIWNKAEKLSREETLAIRKHVLLSAHFLSAIEGWDEAAAMVEQHHECHDGSGYPRGLKGDEIHPGASMLALADTYFAVTNERSDRSYKKSLFSAVTMINGESGRQFSPTYVEIFNDVIRKLYIHAN